MKPARFAIATVVVVFSMLSVACTTASLAVANLPATFGSYDVRRDVKFGSIDHPTLDVYMPHEKNGEPHSIVIFVHGGGWTDGAKGQYRFVADALTSRGFIAVIPDYRLYPQAKFPAFIDDIAQAVAWTHAHAYEVGGDPSRVFLMGHSAGAQITALISLDDEYLKRAGGDPTWLRGFIGLAGPYDFLPFKDAYLYDLFGPKENFPRSQPVNFVTDKALPALLIHGESDEVVKIGNSRSLANALRNHHAAVTERYYPEMNHTDVLAAMSVYFRNRRPLLGEIEAFISHIVDGETESGDSTRRSTTNPVP